MLLWAKAALSKYKEFLWKKEEKRKKRKKENLFFVT